MKKILVVDDSPFMLTVIRDILSNLNYDVTTVGNGKDACAKIEGNRYDLIMTDMNMPVMDGLEFTRTIRTLPNCKFVPIVMLSSEEDSEKIAKARALGISTFISKPPKESQLRAIMNIILNKRNTPRVPVKIEVTCDAGEVSGETFNISTGGLFLQTEQPLDPGRQVEVSFSLPGNQQPITCRARVAWIIAADKADSNNHPAGMGMEFLNPQEESLLKEFIDSVA